MLAIVSSERNRGKISRCKEKFAKLNISNFCPVARSPLLWKSISRRRGICLYRKEEKPFPRGDRQRVAQRVGNVNVERERTPDLYENTSSPWRGDSVARARYSRVVEKGRFLNIPGRRRESDTHRSASPIYSICLYYLVGDKVERRWWSGSSSPSTLLTPRHHAALQPPRVGISFSPTGTRAMSDSPR